MFVWVAVAYAGTCNVAVQDGRIRDAEPRIGFVKAKAELDAPSDAALRDVVCVLKANPSLPLQIAVHTDADGSASFARRLTQTRAEAIRVALTARGIDPDRLSAVGYGGEQPIADNTTSEGRIQNRRVELWTTRPPLVAEVPRPAPVVASAPVPAPVIAAPAPAIAAAPPPPLPDDLELEDLEDFVAPPRPAAVAVDPSELDLDDLDLPELDDPERP